MRKSGAAKKYMRVVKDECEDSETAWCWTDRWVEVGGGITPEANSKPCLCSGDGQADR